MARGSEIAMPNRIQRKRERGWRLPAGAVCVNRPTRFGNPFFIKKLRGEQFLCAKFGRQEVPVGLSVEKGPLTGVTVVEAYRAWLTGMPSVLYHYLMDEMELSFGTRKNTLKHIKRDLAGKDLACFCPLDQPCHADVLLEVANAG